MLSMEKNHVGFVLFLFNLQKMLRLEELLLLLDTYYLVL